MLTVILLTGASGAYAAAAGSASDPLVTVSYAENWAASVIAGTASNVSASLNRIYQSAKSYVSSNTVEPKGAIGVELKSGDVISLSSGASITVTSGVARASISSGSAVNATMGVAASNGRLNLNHMYIFCENTSAVVTMGSQGAALIDGEYKITRSATVFTDVPPTAWYYKDVYSAVDKGLISGMSATSYQPDGKLTLAQAIKLSACMHQLYKDGSVTLSAGEVWYLPFVTYAVNNGLVGESYGSLSPARYNAPVTRGEYISIFYNALPASEYAVKNSVKDNAIPDVKLTDANAAEIYAFYRAGIVVGNDSQGTFSPNADIKRSEVAAVLTRMLDASVRAAVTLG